MDELQIDKPFAYCKQVKQVPVPLQPMLRVYKSSPTGLELQIRTHGGIGENGGGTPRNMIAGVSISSEEARKLRDRLNAFIKWAT
jgi:hypothetical protein